jgi:hypothetical protein
MLDRMVKSKIAADSRKYRLTFGGTRAVKYKRLPSGGYRQVQCVKRYGR